MIAVTYGKSPRQQAMRELLKIAPRTAHEIAVLGKMQVHFVREEICRMLERREIQKLPEKVRRPEFGTSMLVLAYKWVPQTLSGSPRSRAAGSGCIASPCISRSFKWNTDWVAL